MLPVNNDDLKSVLKSLSTYSKERRRFLNSIAWTDSNRDPFSVASEVIVQHLLGGELARNQVQKGWDLMDARGRKVQVKYLANAGEKWVNEHHVEFPDGVDTFALVVFEQHAPRSILLFTKAHIAKLCNRLGKRHKNQDTGIQFTQANYRSVLEEATSLEQENLVSVYRIT